MLADRLGPRALIGIALVAGLVFQLLQGSSYVAAFLDPVADSRGVPVAVANLDEGSLAAEFLERLEARETPVAWVAVPSREAALAGLAEKRFFGALVFPANFSATLATFSEPAPRAASLEVFTNPGASATGSLVAQRVTEIAIEGLRDVVRERALARAEPVVPGAGLLTVEQARFIAEPVVVTERAVNAVPPRGANGLAPVYLAMGAWLGGYFGAVALERFRDKTRLEAPRRSLLLPLAAVGQGVAATGVLLGIGLTVRDPLLLGALLALGTWMAYSVVSALIDVLGLPGVVPAFAIMALGLPASGGLYPVEMLPPFFAAVHAVDPFSWLVAALQSALYAPDARDVSAHALRLAGVALAASGFSLMWARFRSRRVPVTGDEAAA